MIHRDAAEDVSLMFRPSAVFRNTSVIVKCGETEVMRKKAMIFTPGEMAVLTLKADQIHQLTGDEIVVEIERN